MSLGLEEGAAPGQVLWGGDVTPPVLTQCPHVPPEQLERAQCSLCAGTGAGAGSKGQRGTPRVCPELEQAPDHTKQ